MKWIATIVLLSWTQTVAAQDTVPPADESSRDGWSEDRGADTAPSGSTSEEPADAADAPETAWIESGRSEVSPEATSDSVGASDAAPRATLRERSKDRVQVALAFSHWFSPRLGAPQGITTPTLRVGVRPGVEWLELRLRYVVSVLPLTLPGGADAHVGFGTVEAVLTHGFDVVGQSIDFHVGVLGGVVHSTDVSGCFGVVLGFQWLLDLSDQIGLGPYFEARMMSYPLPGDGFNFPDSLQADAQLDLGIVLGVN